MHGYFNIKPIYCHVMFVAPNTKEQVQRISYSSLSHLQLQLEPVELNFGIVTSVCLFIMWFDTFCGTS
jgi:hypothetical protein